MTTAVNFLADGISVCLAASLDKMLVRRSWILPIQEYLHVLHVVITTAVCVCSRACFISTVVLCCYVQVGMSAVACYVVVYACRL